MKRRNYSTKWQVFAKPIRLSPRERRGARTIPIVGNYVKGFKARGLKGIGLAKAIVEDIRSFKKVALHLEDAKRYWVRRSAEEIIGSREQYIMIHSEAAKTGKAAILGCTDLAVAMMASLRYAGFPALIVRAGTHTYVKLWHRGGVWIANPREGKRQALRPMTRADIKLENQYKKENAFAEGETLEEIGLKAYDDFFKYEYKEKR